MAVKTVQATVNGQVYTLTLNSSTGKYEATITAPSKSSFNMDGGVYGITVKATDMAGNTSSKDSSVKVVEKVKPTITITSPSLNALLTNNKPTITAQLRDEDSGIDITTLALQIDGGSAIGSTTTGMTVEKVSGGYNITYVPQTALSDERHTVSITVSDNDGNKADTATVAFSVDTIAPELSVTAPVDGLITNIASVLVTGTTNDNSDSPVTVKITLNDTDQGTVTVSSTGSFSKSITLVNGTNTIVVTSTDEAGKSSSVTRTVILDTVAPTIKTVTVTPNPVDAGKTFVISVDVTD